MARIPMTNGFQIIPEGVYVFKVAKAEYDEEFGKLVMEFVTQDGKKLVERFSFVNNAGEPNVGACNAFSYLAKTIMQDDQMADVDPDELVGKFLRAEVKHTQSEYNGTTRTYAHLGDKSQASGWDNEDAGVNLDDLLG